MALLLKRASASRPSGEWSDDDYDVLADGVVVGRIMKAAAAPRRPVSLEGLSAFARSQKFLPPPEFDREYEGQLVVARVSPRELAAACPSAKPGRVVLGCARPGRGRCEVTIVNDDVLRSLGWTYEVVFVHERIVKIGGRSSRGALAGGARRLGITSANCCPRRGNTSFAALMRSIEDFEFHSNDVVLRGRKTAIVSIVPDAKYPQMWRVVRPDGSLSDMVNRTRAKDAALALARSIGVGGTTSGASPMRRAERG